MIKFNDEFLKASRAAGLEPSPGPLLEGWMKDNGFSDVKHKKFFLPAGTWPADKHLVSPACCYWELLLTITLFPQKEVGAWNLLQMMEGLEAFTYALFTRQLGYSRAEVDVICTKIRNEMTNAKIHAYLHL